jgi:homoaconitate hydratase
LNPKFFTPFILENRDKVSSTSAILNLLSVPLGQNTDNVSEAWKTGIWSVQVMQPELQIARSYTPLPPLENAEPERLRLFVRQEPQGEVSTFLHKISRGTVVHLRGPQLEYEIPQDVDEVLFIAGGTGIAPALQLAHTLFKYRVSALEDGPRLRILWANRRREDSYKGVESQKPHETVIPKLRSLASRWQGEAKAQPREVREDFSAPTTQSQSALVEEVESLKMKHAGKVNVDYFVDEDKSYITENVLRKHLGSMERSLGQTAENQPTSSKKIILISGPEGFINFYAGPKFMKAGKEEQGPLRGILGKIDLRGWDVWKL